MNTSYIKKYIPVIIICILFGFSILSIAKNNLMSPDEYNYSFVLGLNPTHKISSFSDLIFSQKSMYNTWTGRILVHSVIQFFLWIGLPIFYVVNSIMMILFLFLIIKISGNKFNTFNLTVIICSLLTLIECFGEKFIWVAGTVNYLWSATSMLVYIYYLYNIVVNYKKLSPIEVILFLLSALTTGLSQENITFVTGSFIIILAITNFKKFIKFDLKKKLLIISSVLLFGLGFLFLITAPGNFARLDNTGMSFDLMQTAKNLYGIKELIILTILSMTITFFLPNKSKTVSYKKIVLTEFLHFILPTIIAIIPMTLLKEFYPRAMLPYETLILIVLLKNCNYILDYFFNKFKKLNKNICLFIAELSLFIIATPYFLYTVWFSYKYVLPYKNEVESFIAHNKMNGNTENIIIPQFEHFDKLPKETSFTLYHYAETVSSGIINSYMSKYFEVDSIQAIEKDSCIVEISIDIDDLNSYKILDTDGNIYRERIVSANLPMPATSLKNTIIYTLPKEYIYTHKIELPQSLKNHISNVTVKTVSETKNININNIAIFK